MLLVHGFGGSGGSAANSVVAMDVRRMAKAMRFMEARGKQRSSPLGRAVDNLKYANDVKFKIVGEIHHVETIASGRGIHILDRLVRLYGKANWRKVKGWATVAFEDGTISEAELHWFEAHGVGKRRVKIKRVLD